MSEPRWVSARYAGKCSECECDFSEGEQILWVPNENTRADTYCKSCGDDYEYAEQQDDHEVEFDD